MRSSFQQQKTSREILAEHGRLKVSTVAKRENCETMTALFDVALEVRDNWSHRDAVRFQHSLMECDLTIAQWLEQRAQ